MSQSATPKITPQPTRRLVLGGRVANQASGTPGRLTQAGPIVRQQVAR